MRIFINILHDSRRGKPAYHGIPETLISLQAVKIIIRIVARLFHSRPPDVEKQRSLEAHFLIILPQERERDREKHDAEKKKAIFAKNPDQLLEFHSTCLSLRCFSCAFSI